MVRHISSGEATSLVAWFYDSSRKAYQSLLALQDVEQHRGLKSLGVSDAAVISEASTGRIQVDRTIEFDPERQGGLADVFPPSILSQPALGADLPAVSEHFSALGFHANPLREIGENLPTDGAALVVLLKEEWFDELNGVLGDEVYLERWALDVEGPNE